VQIDIDTLAEAEPITALGDVAVFRLEITGGRRSPQTAFCAQPTFARSSVGPGRVDFATSRPRRTASACKES
jgi:hypothetical protein